MLLTTEYKDLPYYLAEECTFIDLRAGVLPVLPGTLQYHANYLISHPLPLRFQLHFYLEALLECFRSALVIYLSLSVFLLPFIHKLLLVADIPSGYDVVLIHLDGEENVQMRGGIAFGII